MTSTELSALAGVLLSLLFEYTPKLSDWYNALSNQYQKLVMAGVLIVAALVAYGLTCGGLTVPGVNLGTLTCTADGAKGLVEAFIAALVSNQATYLIARKTNKTA